jgi:hypothetical protein
VEHVQPWEKRSFVFSVNEQQVVQQELKNMEETETTKQDINQEHVQPSPYTKAKQSLQHTSTNHQSDE